MKSGSAVAIASQKGGVGKTTLTLNLGYALAHRGWRTLVVDADPQGGIALSLQASLPQRPGLVQVLDGGSALDSARVTTRLQSFHLLPFGILPLLEADAWSRGLADGRRLGAVLDEARQQYDVVLLDTAPGLVGATIGVLRCADVFLLPMQAEPLAGRAARALLGAVAGLRQSGPAARFAGLVLTMLQSRDRTSLDIARESWRLFPAETVLDTTIPRDASFLEASAAGVPVALLSRRPPPIAAVFDQLAAELEPRLGLISEEDGDVIPLLD